MNLPAAPSSGFILIDKPAGPTSMTMVRIVKRCLGISQVGHLGTLDPFASGLLPILVGGATRLNDSVMDGKKAYSFTIQLGTETDTLDPQGKVICEGPVPPDFAEKLPNVLSSFLGRIEQVPPVYSAIKMDGMSLYEHMRSRGGLPREIETKTRQVDIHEIALGGIRNENGASLVDVRVVCGKGTYVRSLARDIARALGTCGHCLALRREFVEPWSVCEALPVGKLEGDELVVALKSHLRPPQDLVPAYPVAEVCGEFAEKGLLAGNGFVVMSPNLSWLRNSELLTQSHFWGFVQRGASLMFLAEFCSVPGGYKIQPRKKI